MNFRVEEKAVVTLIDGASEHKLRQYVYLELEILLTAVTFIVIIQRRFDGAIDFNRDWDSYKSGFGFLNQEFWLDVITWCQHNMIIGNCENACQRTCETPGDCQEDSCVRSNGCVCPHGFLMKGSDCVPQEQCGCYVSENRTVIPEGAFYVTSGCGSKGVCTNGQIDWEEDYTCSHNAVCDIRNDIRQCFCDESYIGDGQICNVPPKDCAEVYDGGSRTSGIYKIRPTGWTGSAFEVFCNMTDGGGWTVFQRRQDGSVDFYLLWASYKEGFGNLSTEFWIGNDKLYYLTNQKRYEIRIDLVNREYNSYYGKFDFFRINDESDNYRLSGLGNYSGTVDKRSNPDGTFLRYHLNHEFSTQDRDNDAYSYNCADYYRAGWWYNKCYYSNLNGDYNAYLDSYSSIACYYIPGPNYNIKYSEMKIRPV
ncbi:hypothetical protein BSL78_25140 [Apostichopus japonicus]|uniref:Fibrinogen C-terminal domain-containing protein n=1 Tax=Stichopus japonicus TaxID=307972 RepID=A0A2G8JQN9_STIJA|nr:hypothetical protein BSL78_25140 [Apostichopus japonicus]